LCVCCCNFVAASTDYPTFAGIVTFEAGSTSERSIEVRVEPDDVFEANETFVLTLFVPLSVRSSQNLEVTDDRPVVTIVNDDSKLCAVIQE